MPIVPFIPAIVSAGATIYGSRQANKGQQQAAQASNEASAAAIAEQRRQFDLSRGDQLPWLQTGGAALGQLAQLYGLNQNAGFAPQNPVQPGAGGQTGGNGQGYGGDPSPAQGGGTGRPGSGNGRAVQMLVNSGPQGTLPRYPGQTGATGQTGPGVQPQVGGGVPTTTTQPGTGGYNPMTGAAPPTGASGAPGQYNTFWQSPDYQVAQNEAQRALTARNAALGIQDSGAAQRSALQAGANIASQSYNNYANRLSALAGVGQTAASNLGNLGANFAGAVGNIGMNNAQNQASSYIAQGNQNAQTAGSIGGLLGSVAGNVFGGVGQSPTSPGGRLWGLF